MRRTNISITIDPEALELIDRYAGINSRGAVIDELVFEKYGDKRKAVIANVTKAVEYARANGVNVEYTVSPVVSTHG